jgi:hypothetical protein
LLDSNSQKFGEYQILLNFFSAICDCWSIFEIYVNFCSLNLSKNFVNPCWHIAIQRFLCTGFWTHWHVFHNLVLPCWKFNCKIKVCLTTVQFLSIVVFMRPKPSTMIRWLNLGNCDMIFFNFRYCRVQNFKILNQSRHEWNFVVNFWKHQKWKQKSTKYIKTDWKQSIMSRNFRKFCQFCETSLSFIKNLIVFHLIL